MGETVIYRVEDRQGAGPYRGPKMVLGVVFTTPQCPGILTDFMGRKKPPCTPDHVCGFSNLKQFRDWFTLGQKKILQRKGFVLARYSVPEDELWRGGKQIVFNRAKAKKLKSSTAKWS